MKGKDSTFLSLTAGFTKANYALSGEPWSTKHIDFYAEGVYYEIILGLDILMWVELKEKRANEHFIRIGAKKEFYPNCFYVEGIPFSQSHVPLDFFIGYKYEGN